MCCIMLGMNKYIIQTIRAGFVLAVVLFASANTALAAAYLVPAGVTNITATTATINGQVENPGNNTDVWFEWSDTRSFYAPTVVGKQGFWGSGTFNVKLDGLNPNSTYYYRVVAVSSPIFGPSSEAPFYSPVVSFKTKPSNTVSWSSGTIYGPTDNGSANTNQTSTNTTNTTNTSNTTNTTNTNNTSNSSSNNTSSSNKNNGSRNISAAGTQDGFNNTTGTTNSDGFSNNSGASAIGAGDSILPTTLVGWVALLIALLVVLLIVRLIYEESEKRKKARLAKKAAEAQKQVPQTLAVA